MAVGVAGSCRELQGGELREQTRYITQSSMPAILAE